MSSIILTQDSGFIIGPVAKLLGYLMEGIFNVLDLIGIPNIGLSIIIFTIIIYMLMMPLTIKQQKFSKLSAKINPELQAIQAKYKGKNDQESSMAMNRETQAVYDKYGVSPTGSCLQLLIQMPILFALYRVIYAMPAYVGKIKEAFIPLVDKLIEQPGSAEFVQTFKNSTMYAKQFTNELFTGGNVEYIQNTYIDVLNKASTSEILSIADKYPSLSGNVTNSLELLNQYNNFLGLNIANSPSFTLKESFASGAWLMVVCALLIPVLSALTQWINVKLMPQATENNNDQSPMAASMKTMNNIMPIMSAFFCFTLPAGMGLYWIAGSVIRTIQQVAINKHIDKMDIDEVIKANVEKAKVKSAKRDEKLRKAGIDPDTLTSYASMNTKKVDASNSSVRKQLTAEEREELIKKAEKYRDKNYKPGSISARANMVRDYNESNKK